MTITFREATRADVPDVVSLLEEDWIGLDDGPDLAAAQAGYDAMVADGGTRLFVGETGGEIVACYQVSVLTNLSLTVTRRALLEGVRVRSDRRGQGFGAALLADVEARARAAACGVIQFTSNAQRARAATFYERHGFTASHRGFKRYLD